MFFKNATNPTQVLMHPQQLSTIVAFGSYKDVMIAVDTDIGTPPLYHNQRQNRIFRILPDVLMASSCCTCVSLPFVNSLLSHLDGLPDYVNKNITLVADIISVLLYEPQNSIFADMSTVLVGFNEDKAAVYTISPLGFAEEEDFCIVGGSSDHMLLLNNRLQDLRSSEIFSEHPEVEIKMATDVISNSFKSAAMYEKMIVGNTLHIAKLGLNNFKLDEIILKH